MTYSFAFTFFLLGFVFVRYGECVEDVMLSRTKKGVHNSMSSVQYSYSCRYSSPCCRRFWPLFSHFFFSCLSFVSSCRCYLTISLLELGRRLRCREQTAQVSRVFFSFSHPCFRLVLYLYNLILYIYGTYLLFTSDNFQLPFLYDLHSPLELVLVLV